MFRSKNQTFIFVKTNGHFVGCEVMFRRGLYNCGLILYMFYNSIEKASALVNKGKLYSVGFKADCPFVGNYKKFQELLDIESKYNINYFNCYTVAFQSNFGEALEIITVESLDSFIGDNKTVYVFEDGEWKCHYAFLSDDNICLKKLFTDKGYYTSIYNKDSYVAPEWDAINIKMQVYRDLYNIDSSCQYQLAAKICYQDAVCGRLGSKILQPNQIPFRIERDKENYIDYYFAIDKNFEIILVSKQWIKNHINDIANAKIKDSKVVFSF